MAKRPTAELVAVAFGKAVLSLAGKPTVPVVTTLPAATVWQATGAVQVEGIVGTVARDTDLRSPVVSFGFWATKPNSDKPPWGQANELAEDIRGAAFWDWADAALPLDLEPAGVYDPVLVQSARVITEPRRMPDPDLSRAHYTMDFQLWWTLREDA